MIARVGQLDLPAFGGDEATATLDPIGSGTAETIAMSAVDLLNRFAPVFVAAFLVTIVATPIVRRLAIAFDIIDHPDAGRKLHAYPVAYLGGVAVFLGLMAALVVSYSSSALYTAGYLPVPFAIVIGMVAITFTGFADDVWGWDPRLKIAGQLVAAAALALEDVGVNVAQGLLTPLLGNSDTILLSLGGFEILNGHLFYWVGTAIIAFFVLGGCNATNLVDGLDGLLSGIVAIVAIGLLAICLLTTPLVPPETVAGEPSSLAGARIVISLALLGAVLGFLPHNFNPASIFLGDCGSLLLGYMCVVIILMLGERGQTHFVLAGLIVFAVPIMDTALAIIRRWLAGTSLSAGDDQHMHHQLKRSLGGVKRAVLALYGISTIFALVGVALVALVLTGLRVRFIYAIALVIFSSIGVIAVKEARRQQLRLAGKSPAKHS